MASNAQRTPISRTLPLFVERQIRTALDQLGTGLPGHVTAVGSNLVTIAFDVTGITIPSIRMPVATSEYVRLPIQVGDKGYATPASKYYIGTASGLGTGTGNTTPRGNLSSLVWEPISSKVWSSVDGNTLVLYGPSGVQIRDKNSTTVVNVNTGGMTATIGSSEVQMTTSMISLTAGGHNVTISSAGVAIDGVLFLPHIHTGGTISGDTGPVIP